LVYISSRRILHERALAAHFGWRSYFVFEKSVVRRRFTVGSSRAVAIVPLPHRPGGRTPRQTRRPHRVEVVLLGRHPPKGKLTLVGLVIGRHGQRQSHFLDEKFLCRDFAAVDADAGTPRFLQETAPLDEQSLVLHGFAVDLDVVDLTFSHQPLAGNPGRPGVHAGGKLREGSGKENGELGWKPTREERPQGLLGNFLDLQPIAVAGIESGAQLDQAIKIGFGKLGIDTDVFRELGPKDIQKNVVNGLAEGAVDVFVVWFRGKVGSLRDCCEFAESRLG